MLLRLLLTAAASATATIKIVAHGGTARAAVGLGCEHYRYHPDRYAIVRKLGGGCFKEVALLSPLHGTSGPITSGPVVLQTMRNLTSSPAALGPEGNPCPQLSELSIRRHFDHQLEVQYLQHSYLTRYRYPLESRVVT